MGMHSTVNGVMTNQDKITQLAIRFNSLGCFGLFLGLVIASAFEVTLDGSTGFLLLKKSVSELGYYGHSGLALIVNGGIFFGGLSIALASLFALQVTQGWLKYPFWLSFFCSFLALATTGLFPLNVYHLHIYGLGYLMMFSTIASVVFIAYAIQVGWQQLKLPLLFAIICLLLNLSVFILPYTEVISAPTVMMTYLDIIAASAMLSPKPEFWWQALIQWCSDITLICWVLSLLPWLSQFIKSERL